MAGCASWRGLRSRRREVVYEKAALIKTFQPVNLGQGAAQTAAVFR
jgi:hypothetical protein